MRALPGRQTGILVQSIRVDRENWVREREIFLYCVLAPLELRFRAVEYGKYGIRHLQSSQQSKIWKDIFGKKFNGVRRHISVTK